MNTSEPITIRVPTPAELPLLAEIELAAAPLLRSVIPAEFLLQTSELQDLEAARKAGTLWVAAVPPVGGSEQIAGFAHVESLAPGHAHLEELDVHPDYQRRGIGKQLVATVIDWFRLSGNQRLTLSTFRDIPFNRPFYESMGFIILDEADLNVTLRELVIEEQEDGLEASLRVMMEYRG